MVSATKNMKVIHCRDTMMMPMQKTR